MEWVKRSTLRWFGHVERIFVKNVYRSSVEGPTRRGRPLGRWEDKVKEYVSERAARRKGLEWAKEGVFHCVWIGRGEDTSAEATLLRGRFRRERGVGAID